MDDSAYNRAHESAKAARQMQFEDAKASTSFNALGQFVEWCATNAEARAGDHDRVRLGRLNQAADAARPSTQATRPQEIDARALRAVIAQMHLNRLADQVARARDALEAALEAALQAAKDNPNREESRTALGGILGQIADLSDKGVESAGYAALLTYDEADHQGAFGAQRRGELLELERQVVRLYNALRPPPPV